MKNFKKKKISYEVEAKEDEVEEAKDQKAKRSEDEWSPAEWQPSSWFMATTNDLDFVIIFCLARIELGPNA